MMTGIETTPFETQHRDAIACQRSQVIAESISRAHLASAAANRNGAASARGDTPPQAPR